MAEEDTNQDDTGVAVEYIGGSSTRTVTKADFNSLGVNDQGKVVWDEDNDFVAGLTPAAAERLVETHKSEFRKQKSR